MSQIKANYGIKWAWILNNTTNAKKEWSTMESQLWVEMGLGLNSTTKARPWSSNNTTKAKRWV
jgi:hypothetical protein